jgi:hypothetical protein
MRTRYLFHAVVGIVTLGAVSVASVLLWRAFLSSRIASDDKPSLVNVPSPTATWNTYINTKYGFSLEYPASFNLLTDIGPLEQTVSQGLWKDDDSEVMILPSSTTSSNYLDLYVHDPLTGGADEYGDGSGFWSGPLSLLAQRIHSLAEQDGPIGSLQTITVANEPAYQIAVSQHIGWNGAGEVVNGEYLWTFLATKNSILEVVAPDTPRFRKILTTLQLK